MNSPNPKVRWGVLGYARIARESLIPALLRSTNSEFCAIASRDPGKLTECRGRFGEVRGYRGYDELIRDPDIEAVYVPLPNSMHREWTVRAAEQGKHVLCEKPLGLNAGECRTMIAACESNRVNLMEAFMYRYTHRTRQVLEVLRSGVLGEVKFVGSTFRFLLSNPASIKLKPGLGGGSLYDVGCYPVNFTGFVADAVAGAQPGETRPDSVAAGFVREGGVDVSFSGVLNYSSGLIASLNSGFNAHPRVHSEIIGTQGVLEIPDTFFGNAGVLTVVAGDKRTEIPVIESDRYRAEVEDFADAIRGRRPPLFGLAESVRNAETIDRLLAAG
ncbi:MAG: Gfo/Idh/MocA family oxidoreductase [Opitutaceae bacterium]|jgi:predicted dehydrogenase